MDDQNITNVFSLTNNPVTATFSSYISLLSVPILATGIFLRTRASVDCVRFLDIPLIVLGVLLIAVSKAGCVGASSGTRWLVLSYMVLMLLLIIAVLVYTIFAFNVTSAKTVDFVKGQGYEEYRLRDGNKWLQRRVGGERWEKIKRCLQDNDLCRELVESKETFLPFVYGDVSPAQSGCCKPPYECGFIHRNATRWDTPPTGPLVNNTDCKSWSNDPSVLCYDCQSCKAGVIGNVRKDWTKVAIINMVFISLLLYYYIQGCFGFIAENLIQNALSESP